ncbi:hypothetical protein [Rossellomorea aquimaris]|uniref:hypothetical protein n=1 Tax=Rossellomorea aquimaris TaxID=189382 RepID=UPI0007D0817E|nr:hypothetical protein [Rossellomorea aquimaris]
MWWLVILIIGILLFALLIDFRRKKRDNDRYTKGISSSAKPGEDKNYTGGNTGPGGGGLG